MAFVKQTQTTARLNGTQPQRRARGKLIPFILGLVAGAAVFFLLPTDLAITARAVAGCAALMAIWWMTEAIPIPVTALLPLVLFPLLGMDTMANVAAPYANPIIFLVMGGVILGLATQKWDLHRRIALLTINIVGTKPSQLVLGLMIASAVISAWVSNTATAVIMVPIGLSVLQLVRSLDPKAVTGKLSASVLLGIAYAVTIGSMATLIGQPPMALMKAYLGEEHGIDIGFGQWMLIGVPFSAVMLFGAWLVLTKLVFRTDLEEIPGGKALIQKELAKLGKISGPERTVLAIFAAAIFFWVAVPFIADIPAVRQFLPILQNIDDSAVAIAAAVAVFTIPAGKGHRGALLSWESTKEVPWGLLILFGGGLSLSGQFTNTGLSAWIGQQVGAMSGVPPVVVIIVACLIGLGLTELTSNTATAAAFFPIMGAVAVGLGLSPLLMTVAMTLAVSSAYMLPVATPSNAVAFATGELPIRHMIRAGIWLNGVSLILVVVTLYTLIPLVFGVGV